MKNLIAAYDGGVFRIPDHPVGPPLQEIINIDCNSEEEEAPLKMLPPLGFGIDDYKGKKQRGRPRTKRIRSRGAVGDDGERLRKRNTDRDAQPDCGIGEAGHDALMNFSL